ncbi:MAG: hypothetical protein M3R24_20000 [Chloroflexota bacterium]|nr:hypothetical protein [Chloroflexota bacterium]
MTDQRLMWVTEVHNFGGFFGGDTVTLSAVPWPEGEETTLTIDEKALDNIAARHTLAAEMLLRLDFSGERIDRAYLVAARDRTLLNQALPATPSAAALSRPTIRVYHCPACSLWFTGQPLQQGAQWVCTLCGQGLR